MKSKKPFLIVCAASLTLALALPFMGVFAFAEDLSTSVSIRTQTTSNVNGVYFRSYNGSVVVSNVQYSHVSSTWTSVPISPINFSYVYAWDVSEIYSNYITLFVNGSRITNSVVGASSSNPLMVDVGDVLQFEYGTSPTVSNYYKTIYFKFNDPPDPLAPVSDGMDTMISVFGDVIDYIINTPDVAIFVAISVASCAIIPMGIILIKKLIKGY